LKAKKRNLVIAPHPDDETLGVGGILLKKKFEGESIGWLTITSMGQKQGWTKDKVKNRQNEIAQITKFYDFNFVHHLDFPATLLDTVPRSNLVTEISNAINDYRPTDIYLPNRSDIHSDHLVTFDAAMSALKWFRYDAIERIYSYETLSETEFSTDRARIFRPNVFVDITDYLDSKIKAMELYVGEIGNFPFPRSAEALKSLAMVRGSTSGFYYAEALELIKEFIK
jgi:LmbE family N-acetylglucosaminyl deacetylase